MQKSLNAIFGDAPNTDSRSAQFLINALDRNNQKGFDYLEYKQSLGALAQFNMDEQTAFQSAFATASTMGLTKQHLLQTAKFYKNVLAQEKGQFDKALKGQVERQIAGKEKESDNHKMAIEKKRQQIEQLKAEIQKHEAQVDHIHRQIDDSKSKILKTKENFENTFQMIASEIDDDIQKIQTYLGT